MKNRRNYYRILHVQADAPDAIIKASYRALMQKLNLHPDLGGDEWNASLLNEAYAVLSNPHKRAAYDTAMAGNQNTQLQDRPVGPKTRPANDRHSQATPYRGSNCPFCQAKTPVHSPDDPAGDCTRCASPLRPAQHLYLEAASQRAVARMPRQAPLQFFTLEDWNSGYPGILQDLSTNGLQFLSGYQLQVQQIIRIDSGVLSATARVTHSRKHTDRSRYLTGVEFVTLRFHASQGTFVSEKA